MNAPARISRISQGRVHSRTYGTRFETTLHREPIDYRGWGGKLGYVATLIGVAGLAALAVIW